MACTHPLLYSVRQQKIIGSGADFPSLAKSDNYKLVPCGQCMNCRIAKSKTWACRNVLENLDSEQSCFVTLTYAPGFVPIVNHYTGEVGRGDKGIVDQGEIIQNLTLWPEDVQKFIKRLRRRYEYHEGKKLRYYYAGEYGPKTLRPHYHLLLYNYIPSDLEFWKTHNGQNWFLSKELAEIWGMGFVSIGILTYQSAAYVARYTTKKLYGDEGKQRQRELGLIPEFSRMSLKPGIGAKYYEENKDNIYKFDKIILPGERARVVKPPKYYDDKYKEENPYEWGIIKAERERIAKEQEAVRASKSTLDYFSQLKVIEDTTQKKLMALVRPLED